ncbi:CRAL-TRIO domain-containing protein [Baffinella frigidus]|nr:CRAL-TRIO domain-containing protein [Cryptophyta sp. CCMP2293]
MDSSAVKGCAAALVEELKVDPSVALRFARARKGDLKEASPFLRADLAWRAQKRPEATTQADCPTALASGVDRMLGCTPAGLPVVLVKIGLWDPSQYDADEYDRFNVYFMENLCRRGERFILIFDMKGWKLSHALYMRYIARLMSTLQDHYPERLAHALVFRVPGIFAASWRIIKRFIDTATASKVEFIGASAEAERSAFEAVGAWGLIPESYGGPRGGAVPVPNIPGEPNVSSAPPL